MRLDKRRLDHGEERGASKGCICEAASGLRVSTLLALAAAKEKDSGFWVNLTDCLSGRWT
jgi:hypothetical protein